MLRRHGKRFDPHPNWCAAQMIVVTHCVSETQCTPTNVVIAMHQDQEFSSWRGRHGLAGTECIACVPGHARSAVGAAIGLDDDECEVPAGCLAEAVRELDLLAQAQAQDLERCHRMGAELVVQHAIGPAAGEVDHAALLQHVAHGAGLCGEQIEPGEHVVERVTFAGELVADGVQVADVAEREHGRDRADGSIRALAPTDPKVVEPCVEYPAANLHTTMTSCRQLHDVTLLKNSCARRLFRRFRQQSLRTREERSQWPPPWRCDNSATQS